MIFYGKTFAEKQREQKGRDYDRDMRKVLRKVRNETIEECAKIAEAYWTPTALIAAAIRALKK